MRSVTIPRIAITAACCVEISQSIERDNGDGTNSKMITMRFSSGTQQQHACKGRKRTINRSSTPINQSCNRTAPVQHFLKGATDLQLSTAQPSPNKPNPADDTANLFTGSVMLVIDRSLSLC